ncbi:hypothetical protein CJ030_MR5G025394 [Morella rubra]|uniref:Uncharacterized protein n=1 Tax=Morella rubra TaxID=262757 RepID=A0A6A1VJL9_9ROSI|nr:hypothetical protein CJ030_MR5G025394 [Morella rubra]
MESDLSLLEISGEDDSLLLQIPNDDASTINNNYFLCSPLQIGGPKLSVDSHSLGPLTAEGKGSEDTGKPQSSLQIDGNDKENGHANKSEVPKLSMEPQQMKRRKKGGGYNLRKSLAWDRAFFTEEGVLNPMELSILSGSFSEVGGEMLSDILEEGRESLSGEFDGTHDSRDLQACKENLFKELSTSSLKEDRKSGCYLLPKHSSPARDNAAPASAAKQKVLAAHDVNRSGSKHVNVQSKNGSKALDNLRSAQNIPKAGPANKILTSGTSVRQSRRNVVTSTSEKQPSTNLQHPLVSNGLKVVRDPLLPSTSQATNSHDYGGIKTEVSLFQNACYTAGNMQRAQLQTAKPSGLRMPSPSLGFFGKPNAESLRGPLQRSSKPLNPLVSNTHNLRRPSAINYTQHLRAPAYPGKMSNGIKNVKTRDNMKVSGLSLGCSVPSTVNLASHDRRIEKINSVMKMNSGQKMEVEVACEDYNRDEVMKNQQQVHSILDDGELQRFDEKFLLQGACCGQLEKSNDNKKVSDVCMSKQDLIETEVENDPSVSCLHRPIKDKGFSERNEPIDHQVVDDKPHNFETTNNGAFSGSNSGDGSCFSTPRSSKANNDRLSTVYNFKGGSGDQAEVMEPFTCRDDKTSCENQRLLASNGSFFKDREPSEDFLKFDCMEDFSSKVKNCSETELQLAKDEASLDDGMSSKSLVGNAQAQPLDGHMSVAILSCSPDDNQPSMVADEVNERFGGQLELQQNIESCTLEASGVCESKSKRLSAFCLIPPAMQDCSHEVAKSVECRQVKDVSSLLPDSKPVVVGNHNASSDSQFGHDMDLCGQVSPYKLDRMEGDHVTGNDSPKSGDFSGSELENPHLAYHLSPALQFKDGSGIGNSVLEEKNCHLMTIDTCVIPEFQPEDGIGGSHQKTVRVPTDLLSGRHNVKRKSAGEARLVLPCPCETEISFKENQSPDTYHQKTLFDKSQSFERSTKLNCRATAENSQVEGSCGSVLENPNGLSQNMDQPIKGEIVGSNDLFKELHAVQHPAGSMLVDGGNSINAGVSPANQYLIVVDRSDDQQGHPELQSSIILGEQVSEDSNHALCLHNHLLLTNTTSEELKKDNDCASVFEQYHVYESESRSSNLFSQESPLQQDGLGTDHVVESFHIEDAVLGSLQDDVLNADHKAKCLGMEDRVTGSAGIDPSVDNLECYRDTKFRPDSDLRGQAFSLEFDSSAQMRTDKFSEAVTTSNSKAVCSLTDELGLSGATDQASESQDVLESVSFQGQAETSISKTCEMQQELEQVIYSSEEKDAIQLNCIFSPHWNSGRSFNMAISNGRTKPENDKKQDAIVVKPPPHVAPFSDEWLAAFEAAGEVKRKNNQGVGPFDCTKYTNVPPSNSQ